MNACDALTIDTNGETIFLSTADGGSDIDGALAISVYNSGSADALIKANGHHTTVATKPDGTSAAGVSQYLLVPAGKSVTLRSRTTRARTARSARYSPSRPARPRP